MRNLFKSVPVKSSEITPKSIYFSRRDFIKTAGVLAGSAALAACAPEVTEESQTQVPTTSGYADETGNAANTYEEITNYNNYYEFSTNKEAVASLAESFTPAPWTVEVYGMVNKPRTFGIEDLLKLFPQEDRIYRLRCVEAWSMVIPWQGFPIASLLAVVEPTSNAKYLRFETVYRPEEMKGQSSPFYPWPYNEGLRIDEAMNDLAILATGLYGEPMPNQNGAPIRLVVPWKYGFKSIKSIVKIELTDKQPDTLWNLLAPNEYGFYANVNPNVNHPRWSQASERRIGEFNRRETLLFNGYAEQVADLYKDLDLQLNY
ncbi:MAG: putative sulfite oxidase subunit YedY [Chloroflexi bacterium OLB14]|nr:MAG: putative sulfite oxidase subunit YedY [Chloroflexi bacterium OLB14]